LTDVECGNTCNVSADCTYCGPTPTPTPTPTATPVPTFTPTPTPTATPVPEDTPTPTPTVTSTPVPEDTPTPTPTVTSTPVPSVYSYQIGVDQTSRTNACNNFNGDPQTEVFTAESNPAYVLQFFTDVNLTTTFFGTSEVYAYALSTNLSNKYTTNINSLGQSISPREACP
jgi:hypothetical protein